MGVIVAKGAYHAGAFEVGWGVHFELFLNEKNYIKIVLQSRMKIGA